MCPPNSYVEALSPHVTVLERGPYGELRLNEVVKVEP